MSDIPQLTLPSRTVRDASGRPGQRADDSRGFSDALQAKHGKAGAAERGENPQSEPPTLPLRFRAAGHGLQTRLADSTLLSREPELRLPAEDGVNGAEDAEDMPALAGEVNAAERLLTLADGRTARVEPPTKEAENEGGEGGGAPATAGIAPLLKMRPSNAPAVAAVVSGLKPQTGAANSLKGPPEVGPTNNRARVSLAAASGTDASIFLNPTPPEAGPGSALAETVLRQAAAKHGSPAEADPLQRVAALAHADGNAEAPRLPANIRVAESYSLPTPPQAPSPAVSLSGAIAAAPDWMALARPSVAFLPAQSSSSAPIKALTVQLHPAELGAVTAKLRLAGEQLTIELQVERAGAYEKLTGDSDAILKAVRALGIEVDKVTVQQPQAAGATTSRSDGGAAFGGGERETGFQAESGSRGREDGGAGNRSYPGGQDGASDQAADPAHRGPAQHGRGLYI